MSLGGISKLFLSLLLGVVASVLILFLQVLIHDKCLIRCVFLNSLICERLILFRELSLLQLLKLLLQLLSCRYLVLRFGVQLPLKQLRTRYLIWILIQVAVPFGSGRDLLLLSFLVLFVRFLVQEGMVFLDCQGRVNLR